MMNKYVAVFFLTKSVKKWCSIWVKKIYQQNNQAVFVLKNVKIQLK